MAGTSSTSSGSSKATIPAGLQPLISQSAGLESYLGSLAGGAPGYGLETQLQNPAVENIAGLTPQENQLIAQLQGQAGGANSEFPYANTELGKAQGNVAAANNQISELTSGPIGSSPATIAAMNAYNTNSVPQTMQALALSGSGRGGGDTEALTNAREAAYTPLVEQEIANREAGIGQSTALAGTQANLAGAAGNLASTESGLTNTALQAAELPQETAQAKNAAAYQALLQQYGLEQQVGLGPIEEVLGSLLGNTQQSSTTTNPSIFSLF